MYDNQDKNNIKKYYIYQNNDKAELFVDNMSTDTDLSELNFRWYFEEFDDKYISPSAQKMPF